jgi:hypothetical protein
MEEPSWSFGKKLEAQLYPFISTTNGQYRFKVKLNDYWMNLHKN